MFDDPTALRSDWYDSTALGKYFFVPSMCNNSFCNNSFCRVKFPNCLKHNIYIQISIQSINDEWWVYKIMDPHYSNNIFVYEPEERKESLYHIPKWNWNLIYFSWIALIQEMST